MSTTIHSIAPQALSRGHYVHCPRPVNLSRYGLVDVDSVTRVAEELARTPIAPCTELTPPHPLQLPCAYFDGPLSRPVVGLLPPPALPYIDLAHALGAFRVYASDDPELPQGVYAAALERYLAGVRGGESRRVTGGVYVYGLERTVVFGGVYMYTPRAVSLADMQCVAAVAAMRCAVAVYPPHDT